MNNPNICVSSNFFCANLSISKLDSFLWQRMVTTRCPSLLTSWFTIHCVGLLGRAPRNITPSLNLTLWGKNDIFIVLYSIMLVYLYTSRIFYPGIGARRAEQMILSSNPLSRWLFAFKSCPRGLWSVLTSFIMHVFTYISIASKPTIWCTFIGKGALDRTVN